MTFLWCQGMTLLCILLLRQADSEEPEPVFRAQGGMIEMGYCFGVDYIVVYKCAVEGDQLLGNSSANSMAVIPPTDLQGRVQLNQHHQLLGLQIRNLTHSDSGTYRRECWQNQKLVSQVTQQLSVCNEEVESMEIAVKEGAAVVMLLCNSTSLSLEGISVKWYHETYPSYKPTLFLDSSVSLEPLGEDMSRGIEVRDKGWMLVINKTLLQSSQHFHCLVSKENSCLSVQVMYMPDQTESRDVFVSYGDRVVLKCPFDGNNQQWDTPLGKINHNNGTNQQMYILSSEQPEDFSLVIPAVGLEHSGEYSFVSVSSELQYMLIPCPKTKEQGRMYMEGTNVHLECKVNHSDTQRLLWYYADTSGEHKLLHDSKDEAASPREDLKGRMEVSHSGSLLTISNVDKYDEGIYWCVATGDLEFLEHDDNYKSDYGSEETEDEEYGDDQFWNSNHRCFFKLEFVVTLTPPETSSDAGNDRNTEVNTPTNPAVAVGSGVAALVVVVVMVSLLILMRKKMCASHPADNISKDMTRNEDIACTKSLTDEECAV